VLGARLFDFMAGLVLRVLQHTATTSAEANRIMTQPRPGGHVLPSYAKGGPRLLGGISNSAGLGTGRDVDLCAARLSPHSGSRLALNWESPGRWGTARTAGGGDVRPRMLPIRFYSACGSDWLME